MSTIIVTNTLTDFINPASASAVNVGSVNLNGTINIPTGASDGYVLTSDSSGDAYWTASSGSASSQNLSQVLSTGNQTSGNDISVSDNDLVNLMGNSAIILNDTSYITTQGPGSTQPITFNRDGNEFIVKNQGGVLGIYNLATYSGIFSKGDITLGNKPNESGGVFGGLSVTQAPDDNTSSAVTYVETGTKHKFYNLTIRTNGGNYNQSGRVFNEANPSIEEISSSLYYNVGFTSSTINLPTGTQICNSIPNCVGGDYFKVLVINAGTSSVTFNPGSNTSFPISSQDILGANSCKELLFQVTNATNKTVEIFQM